MFGEIPMKHFIKKPLLHLILVLSIFILVVSAFINHAIKSRIMQRLENENNAYTTIIQSYSEELDGEIMLNRMQEITDTLRVEKTGMSYIVDKNGNLIVYPSSFTSSTIIRDGAISNTAIIEHIKANPSVEKFNGVIQNPLSSKLSYTTYSKLSGLDWYAVTQIYKSEINKILFSTFAAIIILIIFLLMVILGLFQSSRFKKKLAESTAHLNATLNALPDMLFEIDLSGIILDYRVPNRKILPKFPNGLVGRKLDEVVPEEYVKKILSIYKHALNSVNADDEVYSFELFTEGFWFEISISIKHNKMNNKKSFIAIAKDITKKKQAEIALLEKIDEVQKANQTKSEFIAKISHEIRTPLNAIIGLNHILMKEDMNTKQQYYLEKVQYSADNLLHLINNILDFSKYDADKLELLNIVFDLFELIDKYANIFYPEIEKKQLTLEISISPQIPQLLIGDDKRIGQVLTNLLANAIKFTESGSITISVNLLDMNAGFVTLEFKISDTGIGVSDEQKNSLFKPFSQADSSITRKYGGTGLGLSICKHIIDKMGGTILLDSQLGVGTCLTFTIVVEVATSTNTAQKAPQHNPLTKEISKSYSLDPLQLLLVEDNEINILVTQEFFAGSGIQVEVANSGLEALELIKHKPFDIILMDLHMPNMDGFEATRKIRELKLDYYPIIIALTADIEPSVKTTATNAGINDILYKPIDPDLLLTTIDKWSKSTNKVVTLHPFPLSGLDQNSPLYLDLLEMFLENQIDCIPRLHQALADNDFPTLKALTHTLKGVAGNLGALNLFEAAKVFESTLKNENNLHNRKLHLAELECSFDETKTAINKLLKESHINKIHSPILENKQLKVKVSEILSYAERNDLLVMDVYSEISSTLALHLSEESNSKLRKSFNSLDWDSIKQILDKILQTL
jgi:PAS domain S-box-containing protein